ncbi:MAG: BirA family biotin operon repressor/biotin-[acetyl-CoA-carboxylase] ligase [Flavobacteriaceae bacterium]|jgi:BirA family biotin operon repressor/biotin-[acetyl-CoA-carboxylase] ligase|uniref:biotin--[acetyl-CoA-carboxylase] ligase n=1 Tax=Candidatus Marifrigoribacter sp. Uisw_064 TaxID=3230970 RepID=UPI003AE72AF6
MNIIKLNAIDSTNSYLIELSKITAVPDETIVVAKEQTKGRGQMGASWYSKIGETLTFSIFKRLKNYPIEHQANISLAVSIGIQKALTTLFIPDVLIKWPNDILSESKKLAGILIENQVKQGNVTVSIIGVGLNVNNESFENLPQATSMFLSSLKKYKLDVVLKVIADFILIELSQLETTSFSKLKEHYEKLLFRKDKITVFENLLGEKFNGKIKGINQTGQIIIETEDNPFQEYNLREIKMLY